MTDCMDAGRREATLEELERREFDLVVIGGGITGAGILRDAALRGMSVALLESEDFAAGTSSKSTKLIHGGIRYLAMGHFHVVREAARERKHVHRLAPHLAVPRWLVLPAGSRLEHLKYRIGVSIYERLGQVSDEELHFNVGREGLLQHEHGLDVDAWPWASIYREYLTDDARLVVANVRGGVAAGGIAVNYAPVTGLLKDHGRVTGVRARCHLSGQELLVHGKAVINAAGPWVESICEYDGLASPKRLVLSKGIHIVVPREKLPVNNPLLMVSEDKRPVFAIPKEEVVYIGTTDTAHPQRAEYWPTVEREEVEYLFQPVKRYFGVTLELSDCRTTWAGLRPLIAQRSKSTKNISRKDEIWVSRSGLITIAGGKLTGYRKMAEDTVDTAVRALDREAGHVEEGLPVPGGDFDGDLEKLADQLVQARGIDGPLASRLVRLYGSEATAVTTLGGKPLTSRGMVLDGEILWAVRQEAAADLQDVLYRRTQAAFYRPDEVLVIIEPASRIMAAELRWDENERIIQAERMRERFLRDSGFARLA